MKKSTFNLQLSTFNYKGFTLLEVLVSVVVVIVVSQITLGIITSALRGTNKVNTLSEVRQNGNYAILQMSRMIEFAKRFDGVSLDGSSFSRNCVMSLPASPTPTPTLTPYSHIKITSFDDRATIFSCTPTTIASNGASLINLDLVSLVPGSCYFTCFQERFTSNPLVGISITLKNITDSILAERRAPPPIQFQTSISVRNFNPLND